jgi:hypothetical protein
MIIRCQIPRSNSARKDLLFDSKRARQRRLETMREKQRAAMARRAEHERLIERQQELFDAAMDARRA